MVNRGAGTFLAAISVRSVCTAAASPFHAEPKHRDVCGTFVPNSCDWNNTKNSSSFNQELLRMMVTGLHFCAAQQQRLLATTVCRVGFALVGGAVMICKRCTSEVKDFN